MLIPFFLMLRAERVPVTLRELLALLEGMQAGLADFDVEAFYFLARAALIKDERHIDRFDRVFAQCFRGLERVSGAEGEGPRPLPEEWLRKLAERHLTEEEKALIESLGGFDALMETLRQRLAEQQERHQGGSKWIGTAGTSPFGAYGYNPEGVRIGQPESRHRRAVKVWDRRDFRDYDDEVEFGTRNIKVALRRLRRFVREGAADELDLPATIRATAEQGYIDVVTRPERRNAVRMLMFLDVGGSMDGHVRDVEMLFSAARSEFRHLEHFYFHNCVYEGVWKTNSRRHVDRIPTEEVLRTYGSGYKLCFVGDAAMSPYELTHAGGSVEHWNSEAGAVWLERLAAQFPGHVWLNPVKADYWGYTASIGLVQRLMGGRMFPLTLSGLTDAMRALLR
ncbi:VWA domain-containing protein [Rhizobium sp. SG2393]|uniref:vWA domain-containing protein n=1 Tax=Rhizobium sp. SG2393 TaxID=3276279 RepID=UPI003672D589